MMADATGLTALWGAFGTVPVAWTTWFSRTVPGQAESGGVLLAADIQVAIAMSASAGGVVLNAGGVASVFSIGVFVLVAAALFITLGLETEPVPAEA